jgi:hypothetical protein
MTIPSQKSVSSAESSALRGMLFAALGQVKHLFTDTELKRVTGYIRSNRFDVHELPEVSSKLKDSQVNGTLNVSDFRGLYQFSSLLKKYPFSGSNDACLQKGLEKLQAGEASCKDVNETIDQRFASDPDLFRRVQAIVEDILGIDVPCNFLDTDIFFGPGSTTNLSGRKYEETSLFFKISDKLLVPAKAAKYLAALLSYQPNWVDMLGCHYHIDRWNFDNRLAFELAVFKRHFIIVDDNYPSKIGFVPKSSEEYRAIGIEMNGLVPLQKVVGSQIRSRLKSHGIDLDSQGRNRHMARLAKVFGLATIDLANASSSISLELVRKLLPPQWFCLISAFRAETGVHKPTNTSISYEMVSSMGNGYTFELESLIFFALAKAIAERSGLSRIEIKRSISIFGDDIIVPQRIVTDLISSMKLFGFTVNLEKSFVQGYFFESCGSDYYRNEQVRPFFIKRSLTTQEDLLFCMNSIMLRAIKAQQLILFDVYKVLFKKLQDGPFSIGPLHFDRNLGSCWNPEYSSDDLEACLRLPLVIAQAMGGVSFDIPAQSLAYYRTMVRGVEVPLSQNPQYAVRHVRYFLFLRGFLNGKALLRGRTVRVRRRRITSRWDGDLGPMEMRIAALMAANLIQ